MESREDEYQFWLFGNSAHLTKLPLPREVHGNHRRVAPQTYKLPNLQEVGLCGTRGAAIEMLCSESPPENWLQEAQLTKSQLPPLWIHHYSLQGHASPRLLPVADGAVRLLVLAYSYTTQESLDKHRWLKDIPLTWPNLFQNCTAV